jgi:ribonuclease HI
MLVTINTDASFHPTEKIGAFAFWAVSNGFKIQKACFFRDKCLNPTDAESKAILNAFHVVSRKQKGIRKIIFNTDSLNAKAIFENDRDHIHKYHLFNKLRSNYNKKEQLFHGIEIEFRHVKAHSGKDDARSYVNEWCDTNAKYYMWKRFHQLNLKPSQNEKYKI